MEARFPDSDLLLIESGGDNPTLTFSPALVDSFIYVIDVAPGDKIPRKNGPGISRSDILVTNKTDPAPHVGADLGVMNRDSRLMRGENPFLFGTCRTGELLSLATTAIRPSGRLLFAEKLLIERRRRPLLQTGAMGLPDDAGLIFEILANETAQLKAKLREC